MKRIILAGVLGAIAMFVWTSIAHTVLPLGEVGFNEIPNEAAVLSVMAASMGSSHGLYIYPGMGLVPDATMAQRREAMEGYEKKLASTPSGILVYHPPGETGMMARRLTVEFGAELIVSLIVVWLLSQTRLSSFGSRVAFVTLAGLMASMMTNVQYWNWYGFPGNYTFAYIFTQLAGFLVLGLVAATVLRKLGPMVVGAAA